VGIDTEENGFDPPRPVGTRVDTSMDARYSIRWPLSPQLDKCSPISPVHHSQRRLHVRGYYLTTGNRVSRWLRSRCQRLQLNLTKQRSSPLTSAGIPRDRGHFGHRTSLSYRHYECPLGSFPVRPSPNTDRLHRWQPSMLNSPTGTTHPVAPGHSSSMNGSSTTTSPLTPIPATGEPDFPTLTRSPSKPSSSAISRRCPRVRLDRYHAHQARRM